jgi:ATP/maltotriose-dependent transcriptional regulator MalT
MSRGKSDFHTPRPWEANIPATPHALERPRLLKLLEAVTQHRLTLISAPPGYGKSTLAAQFARRSQVPVAWHSIEEHERDYPNLHAHALSALAGLIPGIEHLQDASNASPAELATRLINLLREHIKKPIIYVLDDVHRLNGASGAENWLRALVAQLTPACCLMILSRTTPRCLHAAKCWQSGRISCA